MKFKNLYLLELICIQIFKEVLDRFKVQHVVNTSSSTKLGDLDDAWEINAFRTYYFREFKREFGEIIVMYQEKHGTQYMYNIVC